MGRSALRLHRIEGQRARDRGRDHRVLPHPHVRFQDAEGCGVRTHSEDIDWQDSKIHVAQSGEFGKGDLGLSGQVSRPPTSLDDG